MALCGLSCSLLVPPRVRSAEHDYSVLRINEVLASNSTQPPADGVGKHRDMVEIYNSGPKALPLGGSTPDASCALSGKHAPTPAQLWTFPGAGLSTIPAGGYLVVFLDQRPANSQWCEPYAGFSLKNDGSEPIALWGPVKTDASGKPILDPQGNPVREKIDEVWLPPLRTDVSFGRKPSDPGPALLPPERTLDHFVFYPPGQSTFGTCVQKCPTTIDPFVPVSICVGAPNGPGGPLAPRVERVGHSTNRPAEGQPVELVVRVFDEKEPTPVRLPEKPEGIQSVELFYRVDGGEWQVVAMQYDEQKGLLSGADEEPPRPLALWTEWKGSIPGQTKGAVVEFRFQVTDSDGLSDATPAHPCQEGVGPCDREFGGPNCERDLEDEVCQNPTFRGARYFACDAYFRYLVGYVPSGGLEHVIVNEVVPRQFGILTDVTERDCTAADGCPPELPDCCKQDEDFLELWNLSTTETVDLSGVWLSDKTFEPRRWQFPPGSKIRPGEYLIVWLDDDGAKCPDPAKPSAEIPCFWECPDPTDPAKGEYHTNFALDADGDQIYLFAPEDQGYGVVDGTEFLGIGLNEAWARRPDSSGSLVWVHAACATPRAPNACCPGEPVFLRGDSDGTCAIDLTDAVFTLNYLFLGGGPNEEVPRCMDAADADDSGVVNISDAIFTLQYLFLGGSEPPAPGPVLPAGCDPTADDLEPCVSTCGS
ncbi:MAG: lamin tail domain-containing protein [Planctomycetota bacterium]